MSQDPPARTPSGRPQGRRQRCTAKAKGSGEQCKRWARDGYTVCPTHGAGTRVRQARPAPDGRVRRDPGTAAVKTGVYAAKTKARFGEALGEFLARREELFDVDTMAARLWTALLTIDEVESTFDLSQLLDPGDAPGAPPGKRLCECGQLYSRADVARDILNRIYAVRGIVHELLEATRVKHKLEERQGMTIGEGQLVAILVMLVGRVHELCQDPGIDRDEIPRLLTAWIGESAKAVAGEARPAR